MNKHVHIKVFLADDHPVVIYGVSAMLHRFPEIEMVGVAQSGEEMMKVLPQARPHVLLLDLNMPGKDFNANITWVKANSPWVKILAYSSYHSSELVKALIHAGAMGYLPKTATPNELLEAICAVHQGEAHIAPMAYAHSDNGPLPAQTELQDDFRKRLGLSRREQEILVLISRGMSSLRIGQTLYISKHTVETHRKNILRKLDFNTSTELVKFAVRQGLV